MLVIRILVDTENDKVILHEGLAEGTNIAIARSPIASLVYNNILIVETIAEYCKLFKNDFLFPKFRKSVADAIKSKNSDSAG